MKRETEKIKEMLKQHRGITLIALVVTIVVLIILAVISINAVFGENGLISSAETAEVEHTHATVWERIQMAYSDYWAGKVGREETSLIEYLKTERIIEDTETEGIYKINVETLAGTRLALGNGEGETDVYKLEEVAPETGSITKVASREENIKLAETEIEKDKTYRVMYYGENASKNRELGVLADVLVEVQDAKLKIDKKIISTPENGEYYVEGNIIQYEIIVENTGNVKITNINITDELVAPTGTYIPEDEEIILDEDAGGRVIKNGYSFSIDSLEEGETITFKYSYKVQSGDIGGKISNKVIAMTGNPKPKIPKGEKLPEIETPEEIGKKKIKFYVRRLFCGKFDESETGPIVKEFEAYDGMTWEEWINDSSFNGRDYFDVGPDGRDLVRYGWFNFGFDGVWVKFLAGWDDFGGFRTDCISDPTLTTDSQLWRHFAGPLSGVLNPADYFNDMWGKVPNQERWEKFDDLVRTRGLYCGKFHLYFRLSL